MDWLSLLIISCGLAMDSFAVSISCGLVLKRYRWSESSRIALAMGAGQALMPVVGYFAALTFRKYIEAWDHWLAFVILGLLGAKMIYEGVQPEEEKKDFCPLRKRVLFTMALATSIDALAIGISFAFLDIHITTPVVSIGIITFLFSLFGVWLGSHFKKMEFFRVEVLGGLCLIVIGFKILVEHIYIN